MYKIIFSDIDGTLLDSKQRISIRTKEKIKQLAAAGIPFVLASSRPENGVFSIIEDIGIKAPIISYSGALIHDDKRNIIRNLEIPPKMTQEIHDFILSENQDICCCVYSRDLWLVDDKNNSWVIQEENITDLSAIEGKLSDYPQYSGAHKLLCMGDKDRIDDIMIKLRRAFPKLCLRRSKDTYLEINHSLATKANAMRFLCNFLNISMSQTIAFGDGEVDLEMLQIAGKGFAMRNAVDKVKNQVKYIADSNDDEGILSALIRMGM